MKKKCEKLESLFIFSDDEALKKHLAECEECKAEYEKMQKVSKLIQEVKPHYTSNKRSRFNAVRIACILFAFVISGITFHIADTNYGIIDTVRYGSQLTADDLGFQTDDYGLIMVDD